ncbi:MAG: putative DNA binding domain-containing protein [Prevotella sp.]|nr:putative DNA binding domain-containing protein [Prevotella sp.]
MNKFTIQQLQQMRESEDRVEFKAGEGGNVSYDGRGKTNPKDRRRCILGYVIALCNEGGGRLVIGMHDNYPHRVNGTRQAQDAIGQLESDIYRDTAIRPEIYELYDEENRRVLVIEVPSRPIGKVFKFEDVPLMRVGEELKPMSDAMYLKILQESEPDFSEKICEGLTLEDLDEEAIRVMKQGYAQRWNKPEFVSTPTLQVLRDFALMNKDGQLTNAALILLGKSEAIRKHLYCNRVTVEYRLYHSMIEYTARQEFQQPLLLMVDSVWNYINQPASNPLQHYNDGFRIGDIPAFNREVVREAILNACCHRVMYIQSDVVIKQYPDQLIITNAGGFPVGVDVDNILTVNSMPRCKLITEVLQKAGFIEKSGQGVDKMFYHCLMDGKLLPDYSLTDDWQVCLRLPGEIKYPAFMLYARELQNDRPATTSSTYSTSLPSSVLPKATANAIQTK